MVKLRRTRRASYLLGAVISAWAIAGCAQAGSETRVLDAKEAKLLLSQLPYRYEFRSVAVPDGADAAVAGRVVSRRGAVLNFGIALGHGHNGVPIPRAGTNDSYGYQDGGFIFTGDLIVRKGLRFFPGPQFKTRAQWREAGHMEVSMTDKLCLAATGEHCPP